MRSLYRSPKCFSGPLVYKSDHLDSIIHTDGPSSHTARHFLVHSALYEYCVRFLDFGSSKRAMLAFMKLTDGDPLCAGGRGGQCGGGRVVWRSSRQLPGFLATAAGLQHRPATPAPSVLQINYKYNVNWLCTINNKSSVTYFIDPCPLLPIQSSCCGPPSCPSNTLTSQYIIRGQKMHKLRESLLIHHLHSPLPL